MIKILLILFLIPSIAIAGANLSGVNVNSADIPSMSAPAPAQCPPGPYDIQWDGEYQTVVQADLPEVACYNSGSSNQLPAAQSGAVIGAFGALDGNYGALLNAADDYVEWSYPDPDITGFGTIEFDIEISVDISLLTRGKTLAHIGADAPLNYIIVWYDDLTEEIRIIYRTPTSSLTHDTAVASVVAGRYKLMSTWDTTADNLCSKFDNFPWACTSGNMSVADDASYFIIGDNPARCNVAIACWSGTDQWKLDNFILRDGYEGP